MTKHLPYAVLTRTLDQRISPVGPAAPLAPSESTSAERHLARCGVCRSERAWLQRLRVAPTPLPNAPPLLRPS